MTENNAPKEITIEQRKEYFRQCNESLDFMREHLLDDEPFSACIENAERMAQHIRDNNLPWDRASLNKALDALRPLGVLKFAIPEQFKEPIEEPVIAEIPADPYPWGEILTKKMLAKMSAEQFKAWRKNKQWGSEFDRQCNLLTIEREYQSEKER